VPLINAYGSSYQWPSSWAYSNQQDHHTIIITGLSTALTSQVELTSKVYYLGNTYSRLSYANPLEIPETNPNQPYFLPNQPETYAGYNPPINYYDPVALFGSSLNGSKYHLYLNNTSSLGFMQQARIDLPHNIITVGGNIIYGALHSAEYWYGSPNVPQQTLYNDAWNERDQRDFEEGFVQDEIRLFHNRLHIEPGLKYTQIDTTDADNAGYFY
ncbi:TonB-dependent outer membrane receptor, partial [mine drainage metagenome]